MTTLAQDLARALDPVSLAKTIEMEPDDWQRRALRSEADRILLNCSRQSGKSTVGRLLAVHTALYQPGSLTLLLSPSARQSQELFRPCVSIYRALGKSVDPEAENRLSLELETGSRIISLPGQEATIRSFSAVSLLVIDEAARVPDELYLAVRPMLAVSRGRIIAMSTPRGRRGWFFKAWTSDDPTTRWERYEVPATRCPRISPAYLEEERRQNGEMYVEQEYLCKFLDAETNAFRQIDIERAFREGVEPWPLLSSAWT